MDSTAKAVVFYAGGQCTLRPKISGQPYFDDKFTYEDRALSPHVRDYSNEMYICHYKMILKLLIKQ